MRRDEAKAADVRAFRILEGTSAYFRKDKLIPGDIFPSLNETEYTDAPDDDVDPEQSWEMTRRVLKISG